VARSTHHTAAAHGTVGLTAHSHSLTFHTAAAHGTVSFAAHSQSLTFTLSQSDIHKEAAKQVCCNTTYHHKTWPAASRENMIGGTAKRSSSLCKAVLMPPSLSRQSVDKLPLVKDEKAKLVALEIQCMVLGAETLMLPSRLVY